MQESLQLVRETVITASTFHQSQAHQIETVPFRLLVHWRLSHVDCTLVNITYRLFSGHGHKAQGVPCKVPWKLQTSSKVIFCFIFLYGPLLQDWKGLWRPMILQMNHSFQLDLVKFVCKTMQ